MLAFRAYASSRHYVVSLIIHADSEDEALKLLEEYTDVELLGRARLDLLLTACDLTDDELPDPDDFIYVPFYSLTPIDSHLASRPVVVVDTIDRVPIAEDIDADSSE